MVVLLLGLILALFVGEGFNPLNLKGLEIVQMCLFVAACVGMAIAWPREQLGAAISLVAMVLFFAVECVATGRMPHGLMFYLLLVPGLLFLISSSLRKRSRC
jgi:hypothetical protein